MVTTVAQDGITNWIKPYLGNMTAGDYNSKVMETEG